MKEARKGQVMILTVLALGGAVLGATTIAGLLMLYQIRSTTDLANSAKAIYAADSGIELTLFNWFCGTYDPARTPCPSPSAPVWTSGKMSLLNGSSVLFTQTCFDAAGNKIGSSDQRTCDPSTPNTANVTFKSLGSSGNSNRAFGLSF